VGGASTAEGGGGSSALGAGATWAGAGCADGVGGAGGCCGGAGSSGGAGAACGAGGGSGCCGGAGSSGGAGTTCGAGGVSGGVGGVGMACGAASGDGGSFGLGGAWLGTDGPSFDPPWNTMSIAGGGSQLGWRGRRRTATSSARMTSACSSSETTSEESRRRRDRDGADGSRSVTKPATAKGSPPFGPIPALPAYAAPARRATHTRCRKTVPFRPCVNPRLAGHIPRPASRAHRSAAPGRPAPRPWCGKRRAMRSRRDREALDR